jgi:hypothetical protein
MQSAGAAPRLYFPTCLARPFAEIARDATVPLLITEGEKKAACACKQGLPTIGLGGVGCWRTKILPDGTRVDASRPIDDLGSIDWTGRPVYIVFDADRKEKTQANVRHASESLALWLIGQGAVPHIVTLPLDVEAKVGLDDFLMARGPEALTQLLENTTSWTDQGALAQAALMDELNARHAVISAGKDICILDEGSDEDGKQTMTLRAVAAMKTLYANRTISLPGRQRPTNVFDYWLRSDKRREYDGLIFDPSGQASDRFYNLWRGFAVQPRPGDCGLFLAHIRDVVCGADVRLYEWVIAWFADAVQNPAHLPGTAIVMRSGQGTGKGKVAQWMGALFGPHYTQLNDQRHLIGNFNAHLKHALLVFADESFYAGDKAGRGVLFGMITEKTRTIEPKGVDAYQVKNFTRLMVASNHDWVVPAEADARRFCVLDVSDAHQEDFDYFAAIDRQMENGGLQALLHHLLTLDIAQLNLRKAPRTKGLIDQKLESLEGVDQFWIDCLRRGYIIDIARTLKTDDPDDAQFEETWHREIACDELHRIYIESAKAAGGNRKRAMQTELGGALKKWVPGLRRRQLRLPKGKRLRVWVLPTLAECRRAAAARMQCEVRELFDDTDA